MAAARVVVVMGVSGTGKTTVGLALAKRLSWSFADADDAHPPANVVKMAQGVPLTDRDREPWLQALCERIDAHIFNGEPLVLACSALKTRYRKMLQREEVQFVHLEGKPETIQERLEARAGHYMKAGLLESQFRALEKPSYALVVDIEQDVTAIVKHIILHLAPQAMENT